jgi:hypothetical protein
LAVVDVAFGEPLKLIFTGEPTGTLFACTTTGMGSVSCAGRRRSIELKLDPEYEGTGYPPTERIVIEGGLVGTIFGLIVEITGAVPQQPL